MSRSRKGYKHCVTIFDSNSFHLIWKFCFCFNSNDKCVCELSELCDIHGRTELKKKAETQLNLAKQCDEFDEGIWMWMDSLKWMYEWPNDWMNVTIMWSCWTCLAKFQTFLKLCNIHYKIVRCRSTYTIFSMSTKLLFRQCLTVYSFCLLSFSPIHWSSRVF